MYSFAFSQIILYISFIFLNVSKLSNGFPTQRSLDISLPLPDTVIHQFPKPTWVENLAVRRDGSILTTLVLTPDVYLISPSTGSATLVHRFSSVLSLLGITEVGHDKFYIAGGNLTLSPFTEAPGSFSIFEVDMTHYSASTPASVQKIVDIPSALFLNGAATLSHEDGTILVADSTVGVIYKVDIRARRYSVAIDVPETHPLVGGGAGPPIGVNGLKVKFGYAYFTNGATQAVYRVRITADGVPARGAAVEVLASGLGNVDDIAVDRRGRVWIARNAVNTLSVRLRNGTVLDVLGSVDSLTLPGPTSCLFGRGEEEEEDVLFVATTGGLAGPVNGTMVEGGKVVAVDVREFED